MNRNTVALLVLLGGVVAVIVSIIPARLFPIVNYRDMSISGWLTLWLLTALVIFSLGIYTTALVVQRSSRRAAEIEPTLLALGGTAGLLVVVGSAIVLRLPFSWLMLISVMLLSIALSFLGIHLACRFKRNRFNTNAKLLLLRILVPFMLTLAMVWLHYGSFPGWLASVEDRQQWAYQEFDNYKSIVKSVSTCQPVLARVGNVKFVAPTSGENYVISETGSSGHNGELTLEVVGETGVGVANFDFHIFTHTSAGQFIYQNRTEEISCPS